MVGRTPSTYVVHVAMKLSNNWVYYSKKFIYLLLIASSQGNLGFLICNYNTNYYDYDMILQVPSIRIITEIRRVIDVIHTNRFTHKLNCTDFPFLFDFGKGQNKQNQR